MYVPTSFVLRVYKNARYRPKPRIYVPDLSGRVSIPFNYNAIDYVIVTRYSYTFRSVRHISSWFRSVSAIMKRTWYVRSTQAAVLSTLVDTVRAYPVLIKTNLVCNINYVIVYRYSYNSS